MRYGLILGALLAAAPALAQTPTPQQHGLFDTNATDNPLVPDGTPASPFNVKPGPAIHTPITTVTLAPGASAVVVTPGQVNTGCDLSLTGGPFTLAYTTQGSPGTVTASATVGVATASGQSYYHCPSGAPLQGISVYNAGTASGTVSGDVY